VLAKIYDDSDLIISMRGWQGVACVLLRLVSMRVSTVIPFRKLSYFDAKEQVVKERPL